MSTILELLIGIAIATLLLFLTALLLGPEHTTTQGDCTITTHGWSWFNVHETECGKH